MTRSSKAFLGLMPATQNLILKTGFAWLVLLLHPVERNARGILLENVIDDGRTIDHTDLDNKHAMAFKLKYSVKSFG